MNTENKSTEPKKLYEWVKATPDNLPKDEFVIYREPLIGPLVNRDPKEFVIKQLKLYPNHCIEYLREYTPSKSELAAKAGLQGGVWVKASDRLPELPNPLPKNTHKERGILFVNREHSATCFWFPSYGYTAKAFLLANNSEASIASKSWGLAKWEWLDETLQPLGMWSDNDMIQFGKSCENKIRRNTTGELVYLTVKELLSEYKETISNIKNKTT